MLPLTALVEGTIRLLMLFSRRFHGNLFIRTATLFAAFRARLLLDRRDY